jgi:hypothetical protein
MDIQALIDAITNLFAGVGQMFLGAYDTIYDLLIGFYCWVFYQCVGFGVDQLDFLVSAIPADWVVDMGVVLGYASAANAWVPIDVALALIVGYYAFRGALLVYRVVKSWLPTVSG